MQLLFPGCAVLDMMRPLRVVPDRRRFEVTGASVHYITGWTTATLYTDWNS